MPCGELYRFEKYEQAIEDVMTALNIDRDEKAFMNCSNWQILLLNKL